MGSKEFKFIPPVLTQLVEQLLFAHSIQEFGKGHRIELNLICFAYGIAGSLMDGQSQQTSGCGNMVFPGILAKILQGLAMSGCAGRKSDLQSQENKSSVMITF